MNSEAASGKVRLVSTPAYLQANAYRLRGPGGCVLVDPGAGLQTEAILGALADEGIEFADIAGVLLTHYHCDHALSAPWFQERGVPIMASAHTADIMQRGDRRIWYEHPELVRPCPVARVLNDGEQFELAGLRITALATPGHTQGCTTFLVDTADGLCALTGDLLMADGVPGWAGDEYSAERLLESLAKLRATAPAHAYGGHSCTNGRVCEWLDRGMALGRAGQWQPVTDWQAEAVPEEWRCRVTVD
jgi:glyoxylase-like metal-dependent hydrolase (beta-lactamase superfamily II)